MTPSRIQLSRRKGFKLPPDTVVVARPTRWGNPFHVGEQGNAAECVYKYGLLLAGYLCISEGTACCDRQEAARKVLEADGYKTLRGKHLACWCRVGDVCHGDLLLMLSNRKRKAPLDINGFLASYGWAIVDGGAERVKA